MAGRLLWMGWVVLALVPPSGWRRVPVALLLGRRPARGAPTGRGAVIRLTLAGLPVLGLAGMGLAGVGLAGVGRVAMVAVVRGLREALGEGVKAAV